MDLDHIIDTNPDDLKIRDLTPAEYSISPRQLTVKEFDSDSQPREKAIAHGCGILSISELWAIILRTGTPGFPITSLTRQLMGANDNRLHRLERRSRKELQQFKGIGITKAIQIEAVIELIKRYNAEGPSEKPTITNAADIAGYMRDRIGNLGHEEIWAIFLSQRGQVISQRRITTGSAVGTVFDLKSILKHALLEEAQSIIICHNHPSDNLHPSGADDNITRQCKEGCKALDLRLLDHVIITADGHYSYHDNGNIL